MTKDLFSIQQNYWDVFTFSSIDLEFIYNYLIEIELPQTTQELIEALIYERIRTEKQKLEKLQHGLGTTYIPNQNYEVGQKLIFSKLNWKPGVVTSVREGKNPDISSFSVITVQFEEGKNLLFAAGLEDHPLNTPVEFNYDDPLLDPVYVLKIYQQDLCAKLDQALESNPDLVRIARRWFPRTLLVDINIGFLNLAEALLDMHGGGPLPTITILDQIDLPSDANAKLIEFSLNLALQEDARFDEVGPSGEVLWFLHRLEPIGVQQTPKLLQFHPVEYDSSSVVKMIKLLEPQVVDELESFENPSSNLGKATLSLIYPHWRVGTLPLSGSIIHLFPTAFESPRVLFSFIDGDTNIKFPGWVVRSSKYVFGLENWFKSQGVIPGSYIHIERGKTSGEVIIRSEKRRSTRDWVRTALVGTDGRIVFAMVKQIVTTMFDERMAVYIPNVEGIDSLWSQNVNQKYSLEQIIIMLMNELAKLNPQGHVHVQELYAAVNIMRRCPPGLIITKLFESNKATYLGNLYFRLHENQGDR
jgi:hypothetical protein